MVLKIISLVLLIVVLVLLIIKAVRYYKYFGWDNVMILAIIYVPIALWVIVVGIIDLIEKL